MWWLFRVFFEHSMRDVFSKDELRMEILQIAFPAAMALMADPIASLIDTAFVGQIGAVELAAVGVAIAVFNQASRVTIFPVVSITTSFVAEEGIILDKTHQLEELSPLKGSWLLVRVIAVTLCVTLASSMAATQGPVPMAAFQICLQVWLALSLLADGLAIAGQAILASAFAQGDHQRAILGASRVLQLSVVLGSILSVLLGIGMPFASHLFTRDVEVLKLINKAIPFVAATQPINAMAFVFDGINFGASDFKYSACSMVVVAIVSILCVVFLSASCDFVGIWIALTIYMSLRMIAGLCRIGMAKGPWTFLDTR